MLSKKLGLAQIARFLKDKRVLLRADFNVPLKNGAVANTTRIQSTLPTIEYLLENGAHSVAIISHLGRPGGRKVPELSLAPVAPAVEDLLKHKVEFIE